MVLFVLSKWRLLSKTINISNNSHIIHLFMIFDHLTIIQVRPIMLTSKAQLFWHKRVIYNSINSFLGLSLVISANFVYIHLIVFCFWIMLLTFKVINISSKIEKFQIVNKFETHTRYQTYLRTCDWWWTLYDIVQAIIS